ncbi:MAG TPA: hypothetical protein VLJ57_18655, partial [Burkholderiaceae bacterium]|nr:hypothetical protein [Burkholderiaceae bacterium]
CRWAGALRTVHRMPSYSTIYKCRRCGTTSYQPVIARDASGALMPTGMYRCTGCRVTFSDLREWWGHGGAHHRAYEAGAHEGHPPEYQQDQQADHRAQH